MPTPNPFRNFVLIVLLLMLALFALAHPAKAQSKEQAGIVLLVWRNDTTHEWQIRLSDHNQLYDFTTASDSVATEAIQLLTLHVEAVVVFRVVKNQLRADAVLQAAVVRRQRGRTHLV